MKPAQIGRFLDHLGQGASDTASTARQIAPFRPRLLHTPTEEPRTSADFERAARAVGAVRPRIDGGAQPTPPDLERPVARSDGEVSPIARKSAKPDDMAERLAEAYEHGRADGHAEACAKTAEQRAAECAAGMERAAAERVEFQLGEYARLEGTLRVGFAQISDQIGAAVARILTPFLADAVVRRATDDLQAHISRLCSGGAAGVIRIRGSGRVLHRLSQTVADLPVEVVFVEDDDVEAVVEAGATQIVTELRPWLDLLASLDP